MIFKRKPPRVLVIGLDCASPHLIFDQFNLPTLRGLMSRGSWGILRSSIPCITVPAWASMLSSRDPGVLGVYGFRNRADHSYGAMTSADSKAVGVKRIWDILTDAGKSSLVMGVPQTYPVQPLNGHLISDFLTPGRESAFTYPAILKTEVLRLAPDYPFDVREFRTTERADLLKRLIEQTETQYRVFEHLLKTKSWDLAIHVNIALDRIHHAFWRFHDPAHRLHEPDSPFRHTIQHYYERVDQWVGRLLEAVDDETAVLVVSDHGVKRMDGGICINEWLYQNKWLALKSEMPDTITPFSESLVDWSRTRVWGSGGYYARLFLNVRGREPEGVIPPEDVPRVRAEFADALRQIPDHEGKPLNTKVYIPDEIYQHVNGIAPDLIVYFGDLHWRAIGSLGYGRHWTFENDTGADDANHAEEGMYLWVDPRKRGLGKSQDRQLMDIAPTLLQALKIRIPAEMQGAALP